MKLDKAYTPCELMSFIGRRMRMKCVDGEIIKGEVYGYTTAPDSDDDQMHIYILSPRIGCGVDVAEDEIESFRPIQENTKPIHRNSSRTYKRKKDRPKYPYL